MNDIEYAAVNFREGEGPTGLSVAARECRSMMAHAETAPACECCGSAEAHHHRRRNGAWVSRCSACNGLSDLARCERQLAAARARAE